MTLYHIHQYWTTDYTLSCGLYNNYIYNCTSPHFSRIHFWNFISLECKYNELQFGISISSIEVRKQNLCISTSCHVYNKTYRRKSIQEQLLSQAQRVQSVFHSTLVSVQPSPARAYRNSSKGLEETLLGGVAYESAIVVVVVPFCSCDHLTRSKVFIAIYKGRAICWACASKLWRLACRVHF